MDLSFISEIDVYSFSGIALLIFAGFLVGVVNTFAGSGTAISYSLFMLMGLPASSANGTIRIGVIMQTLAASLNFKRQNTLPLKGIWLITISTIAGTILGAIIAISINELVLEKIVGFVMLLMLFLLFYKPEVWIKGKSPNTNRKSTIVETGIFFIIGIYGGFIHIGVGIFLLSALVLISGYDLVKANALKVLIVFFYSPFVLVIFIISGQLNYGMGLIAAIGNLIGGIVASQYAVIWGAKFIRWILIIVLILFSAKLFHISNLI